MANQIALSQQLVEKVSQLEDIEHQISTINFKIYKLSQKFYKETDRIQIRLRKVQASRPRGNPANQWPHRPITHAIRNFYQTKEAKERKLWQDKDLLRQVFDHNRAILTSQKTALSNTQHDIESQIRIIKIQLHWFLQFFQFFPNLYCVKISDQVNKIKTLYHLEFQIFYFCVTILSNPLWRLLIPLLF